MSPATGPSFPVPPHPAPWAAPPLTPVAPPRRRGVATALIAVPALLVGAGAAAVITLGIVGHHTTTTTGGTGSALASGRHTAVGTLTATHGTTWTVTTSTGTVAVDLGPHTAFGSKAHPTSQTAFQDGDRVTVVGTHAGGGLDALRVRLDAGGTTTASR